MSGFVTFIFLTSNQVEKVKYSSLNNKFILIEIGSCALHTITQPLNIVGTRHSSKVSYVISCPDDGSHISDHFSCQLKKTSTFLNLKNGYLIKPEK